MREIAREESGCGEIAREIAKRKNERIISESDRKRKRKIKRDIMGDKLQDTRQDVEILRERFQR